MAECYKEGQCFWFQGEDSSLLNVFCVCALEAKHRIEGCFPSSNLGESIKSGHGLVTFGLDVNEDPWIYNVLSGGLEGKKSSIHWAKQCLSTWVYHWAWWQAVQTRCGAGSLQRSKQPSDECMKNNTHRTRGTGVASTSPRGENWAVAMGTELNRYRVEGERWLDQEV